MYDWLPIDIAASGMAAERIRMNVVASNLANVHTTRTPEGGPFQPLDVLFQSEIPPRFRDMLERAIGQASGGELSVNGAALLEQHLRGVSASVIPTESDPILKHEPGHPDADAEGVVAYPGISPIEQMTNMMAASRMYEANAATIKSTKKMIEASLAALR